MKAIQVSFEEKLLERLDADPEVIERGRSAVLRHAVEMYLAHLRRKRIAQAYRAAYRDLDAGGDLTGWDDEGVWPDE